MSYLLTYKVAERAVELVRPVISTAMKDGLVKRPHLHIVVVNPAIIPSNDRVLFEQTAILYEASFGRKADWDHDYDEIARSKAFISWRTGLPTHVVQQTMRYLVSDGDTKFFGSAVLHGLVVAASGVQPWFDEWVSYMVAATCRALCIDVMQKEVIPSNREFLSVK